MLDLIQSFWTTFLYIPIYNLVVFAYNISPGPNFGLAIIGLAILIRFIFLPFTLLGYRHDQQLAEEKPLLEKIEQDKALSPREKFEKIGRITKPHGINPVITSLPIFAQLVFLGVLYQIIQVGLTSIGFHNLYSFVGAPNQINTSFLGFDLTHPSFILSVAASGTLFIERVWEYNEKKEAHLSTLSQKWDPLIIPAVGFIILMLLPSTKAVFAATSVVFSMVIKAIVHLRSS